MRMIWAAPVRPILTRKYFLLLACLPADLKSRACSIQAALARLVMINGTKENRRITGPPWLWNEGDRGHSEGLRGHPANSPTHTEHSLVPGVVLSVRHLCSSRGTCAHTCNVYTYRVPGPKGWGGKGEKTDLFPVLWRLTFYVGEDGWAFFQAEVTTCAKALGLHTPDLGKAIAMLKAL